MDDIKIIDFLPLVGNRSEELLDNPDRGFRLEVALDVALNLNPFKPGFDGVTTYLHQQYNNYKKDKPKLVQTYFYLSQYEEKELDEKAFTSMQIFFNELKKLKLKALLRFAYEIDFNGPNGANEERMLKHMKQLSPFLEKNKDVIHVYQAGFIGAWGEWHSSKYEVNQGKVLEGILDMVPNELQVQVRLPAYKNLISKENDKYNRIGFHDDFIVLKPHVWDGGLSYNSPQYAQIVEEGYNLLVDGELPWGTWSLSEDGWLIDGLGTINRLAENGYTSLSLIHNYREDGDCINYSFNKWKEIPISEEWLINNKMHFSPAWFLTTIRKVNPPSSVSGDNYLNLQTSGGVKSPSEVVNNSIEDDALTDVKPSVFDYIRDHLGYRLEAQILYSNPKDDVLKLRLEIKNYGFAAPLKLVNSEFVLINANGEIVSKVKAGEPKNWYPHEPGDPSRSQKTHVIEAVLPLTNLKENYKLGFLIENSAHEAVRLANDIAFENGVNILQEV